jgi:hypothetical protein
MGERVLTAKYQRPMVTELGSVSALTLSHSLLELSHFAQVGSGFAASVLGGGTTPSSPNAPNVTDVNQPPIITPSGGGGGSVNTLPDPTSTAGQGVGGVSGDPSGTATTGLGSGSVGTGGGGTGTGTGGAGVAAAASDGKTLPFTGYALALVAGTGLAATAAGQAVRRVTRRS